MSLLVWWFGPLAEWPSNCEKSNHGNGWAVGPQIDFAMAAIPLAPLAAGLARCKGAAQAWRDTCPNYVKERHTSRPEWVKQKQHRTTGFNLFQSDFRKTLAAQEVVGHGRENFVHGAAQAWRQLPAGQKAAYSVRAKGVNRLRSRSNDMLEAEGQQANASGGLWGLSRLQDKWPLCN